MLQFEGHDLKSDIYQVGVLMFELLTGLPPFYCQGDNQKMFKLILE
jgi:serine/threonine protein kinase